MKLYLDDVRTPPESWTLVFVYGVCFALIGGAAFAMYGLISCQLI